MRALITLLICLSLTATVLADDHPYLIPMVGYTATSDHVYTYAYTYVQNLSPRTATFEVKEVYSMSASRRCDVSGSLEIPAYERVTISPMTCMTAVAAVAIVSNEPLSIRTELDSHQTMATGWDKQVIDAPAEWIAAGTTTIAEGVVLEDSDKKASLLVINPADVPLTLTVQLDRPEHRTSSTRTFTIGPRSMQLIDLAPVRRDVNWPFMSSGKGRHVIRITGDGPWQGGVSSVSKGSSMWAPAKPLVP